MAQLMLKPRLVSVCHGVEHGELLCLHEGPCYAFIFFKNHETNAMCPVNICPQYYTYNMT